MMDKPKMTLTLIVECPECGERHDLMESDSNAEGFISNQILNGTPLDEVEGDFICPDCDYGDQFDGVDWQ